MNNSGQNSKKTRRIENICDSLRARADLQTELTETANIEKEIIGAQYTVDNSTFSYHSELKDHIGQTACSEQTARCHAISSQSRNTSESSLSDESTTNSKDSRPFHCFECGKSFTQQTHLNRHQKIYHNQPQSDDHTTSTSRLDLRNLKSSDTGEKCLSSENKAIIMENRSSSQVEPSNCVQGREKPETEKRKKDRFECNICQKTFKHKWYLKIHMRVHTGEKPYVCEVCNKSFSLSSTLTRHALIHTGEKSYKCELCNKTFATKNCLYQHKFSHMKNSFKCEVCNKTFSYKHHLKRHLRVHANHFE